MNATPFNLAQCLRSAVSGTGVHIDPRHVLDGLDWRLAGSRPDGTSHTICQLVNHVVFWQRLLLSGLTEASMSAPATAADGWPGPVRPASEEEWHGIVVSFVGAIDAVHAAIDSRDPTAPVPAHEPTKRANVIATIAVHTCYHLGQIVLMRKQLGSWPPPSGGHTW
ncbi:MAG: DinB family protein [Gemmatimonadales bacterium]